MELVNSSPPRPNGRPESHALQYSILGSIPLDALVCIVDFLPIESQGALSLTCKNFFSRFGESLTTTTSSIDKAAFLELLAIDLRDQIACSACLRLHKFENVQRYQELDFHRYNREDRRFWLPACVVRDQQQHMELISYNFGSTTFKLVMKMFNHQCPIDFNMLPDIFQQDSDHHKLLKAMSSPADTIELELDILIYTEDYIIAHDHLMQRVQSVHLPRNKDLLTHVFEPDVCQHLYGTIALSSETLHRTPQILQCDSCRTEYRFAFKESKKYGVVLVATTWKDLGPGPESAIWGEHIADSNTDQLTMTVGQANVPEEIQPPHRFQEVVSCAFGDENESADDHTFALLIQQGDWNVLQRLLNSREGNAASGRLGTEDIGSQMFEYSI